MKVEVLYRAIDLASRKNGINLNGVWDKVPYATKILMCTQLVDSGNWVNLPTTILEYTEQYAEVA